MDGLYPLLLGFIAGSTVTLGSLALTAFRRLRDSRAALGFLAAIGGGVVAYLAMETSVASEEAVKGYLYSGDYIGFIAAIAVTSIALLGTWLGLTAIESRSNKASPGGGRVLGAIAGNPLARASLIITVALGVHNIGEGLAIAASLLQGEIGSALTFTVGFAVHNATEGLAIGAPLVASGAGRGVRPLALPLLYLSLIAGLPTSLGAAAYYTGITSGVFVATLDTVASASLVYALIKINLTAAGMLGGFKSRFWLALFTGVALTYLTEVLLTISTGSSL